jgi:type II secretory pathway component GspD/PulD (secretin)
MRKFPDFTVALAFLLILFPNGFSFAQSQKPTVERIVVCMIPLEHADAEELAAVLEPFLSTAGSIAPYRPTNTLIIRDRASVVEKLARAIKGKPCNPISTPSDAEASDVREKSHLDR